MTDEHDIPTTFALPEQRRRKADPALVADDEVRFGRIRVALAAQLADTVARHDAVRREAARTGERALERDLEVQRLAARLRVLRRFGVDACLGRMVDDAGAVTYLGRFGLAGADEERLLVDWRAPAAAPFFAATAAAPAGLASRRRYRWHDGRIIDYWDEVFAPHVAGPAVALNDEAAFIASLGARRSPKMRDVLATLQSDQDAIIRAGSQGALVVDGGPGTGKTVVALHRVAYLLYADPRIRDDDGGLLFVGPHRPYVDYVDDVLPGLGEEGALVCAIDDLVADVAHVRREDDQRMRRLCGDARFVHAVEEAVRLWQRPPTRPTVVDTAWGDITIGAAEWAEIFADAEMVAHNVLRTRAWERLLDLLEERIEGERGGGARFDGEGWGDASAGADFDAYGSGWDVDAAVRDALAQDEALRELFDRAWPALDPDALLRGLMDSERMLQRCAPWLTGEERAVVVAARTSRDGWTDIDLPLLDAARQLVGDPRADGEARRAHREAAEARRVMSEVVADLIAADDGDLKIMSMLRGQDLRRTLADPAHAVRDPFAGPFGHIIVDEAQELTDAQWLMLLRRCPSRSLTVVGDRAQARQGFPETWEERLARVGVSHATVATLTVNYRTPEEVMAVAGPVIRRIIPDANVPLSIRSTGIPVEYGSPETLGAILEAWERDNSEGTAVVIGAPLPHASDRVRALDPTSVKGLEFDLVVLVEPRRVGDGVTGAVDRYVAMTRATQRLVILER